MYDFFAKGLLNYLSNIVMSALPDNPDEKTLKTIKDSATISNTIGKTIGLDIVASTENEIDDKVLSELLEACKEAADKYGFSLNV